MKKYYRGLMYCIGLLILALGIILNTKTGLGVAPVISVPYCISKIWNINFGNATLCIYILCVVGQIALRGKRFRIFDLLQIPMSVIFCSVLNIFNNIITIKFNSLWLNLLLLVAAIMLTGAGVAITVEMNILPNAADGLAQAIGERMKKGLGLGKNIVDISCVAVTAIIGLTFVSNIIGIGIGTVASMFGVGRSIALVNLLLNKNKPSLES